MTDNVENNWIKYSPNNKKKKKKIQTYNFNQIGE